MDIGWYYLIKFLKFVWKSDKKGIFNFVFVFNWGSWVFLIVGVGRLIFIIWYLGKVFKCFFLSKLEREMWIFIYIMRRILWIYFDGIRE